MKRHKIKGCKAKALEILKAVKCCKKNNAKICQAALSAEFIAAAAAAEAADGRTAYEKAGVHRKICINSKDYVTNVMQNMRTITIHFNFHIV